MKHSFNLLKEFLTQSVNNWNETQVENNIHIEMEIDEKDESAILWEDDDPEIFCPISHLFDGIDALGFSYFFQWNKNKNRLELSMF